MSQKLRLDWVRLTVSVFGVQAIGWVGALVTVGSVSGWYQTLNKPVFTPPNWVFGPVWTVLYLILGVTTYYIWTSKRKKVKELQNLLWFHLFLNAIWTPIFFGLHFLGLALVVIMVLVATLVMLMRQLAQVNTWITVSLLPYLTWIGFATLLNFSILALN